MENKYLIRLKNGVQIMVVCQNVNETGGLIRFYNQRSSISEQYIKGSEIIAAFNVDEVKYFTKEN
ncbi:hypothetical protein JCM9140_3119 [Halalkalibacter wakoensis JCM 9140]|uniref:Uncharacterized protein n=1 Tax=Halalkalibacter wakoensis JCM 9140 TaxID=1236970 RepID=W4Q6L9_9BACI|nr:hypothetical protein [Halalkalibacter wakoensis]GAE27009.1 hypothetical protein JCM9140_3119 [Halalkalibacter wakoensis JCM 9140]